MDWQEPVALVLAAAAALLLVRMQVRSYRRKQDRACGQECGCAPPEAGTPRPEEPHRPEVMTRQ